MAARHRREAINLLAMEGARLWIDGLLDGWIDGLMDGWIDGWVD
jgi:hypothetical protein